MWVVVFESILFLILNVVWILEIIEEERREVLLVILWWEICLRKEKV